MTNFESYQHSVDCICACYFELDADEMDSDIAFTSGAIGLDELLGWANYDGFYHSVKGYIEVKYPEVYQAHFAWEDD